MSKAFKGGGRGKIVAFAVAIAITGGVVFAPISSLATSHTTADIIASLQAQIAALTAQLAALSGMSGGGSMMSSEKCSFTRDLTMGVTGDDVMCLQKYLNSAGHQVAASGAGSPGSETSYFGSLTRAAVAAWQAANGVTPSVGYFGPLSRAKYDSMMAAMPTPPPGVPGTTPPAAVGSGLSVTSVATQPAATLAPQNAARLPYTEVVFTASADGDVTVNSVTVERQGLGSDSVFAGVVLLDSNGVQLGQSRTLGSDHRVVLNEPFVVKAGTSRTMWIGGNMAASLATFAGQVVRLAVVGVDAGTAQVSGALPIVGNAMTVNASLVIGQATPNRGARDPASNQNKEVGTTGVVFSAIRLTAGSAEDLLLQSVRWNQSGSAASSDLANLKVYVDDIAYDVMVSTDGKYYTAVFGAGVTVAKGESKEVYIKGDISGGSGRTVDFDVFRRTDIGLKGGTYGYGVSPDNGTSLAAADSSNVSSGTPWYDASQVTIQQGSLRVESSNTVASGNVAEGTAIQTLGAFKLVAQGEPIQVSQLVITNVLSAGTGSSSNITSVSVYDANGAVVAGPVDGSTAVGNGTFTFTNTFTVPVGDNVYTVKGKVGTQFDLNQTIQLRIATPATAVTATGNTTGNSLTPTPASNVDSAVMTVKSAALVLSTGLTPSAQNVVRGINQFQLASFNLDATASGEDVRVTVLALTNTVGGGGAVGDLNTCQLFDGATALTTGGNVQNPDTANENFILDTPLTVSKNTTKVVGLKCNISSNAAANGTHSWTLQVAANHSVSGASSGSTFVPTVGANAGIAMTVKTGGSFTITLDASSPAYKIVAAGTADQTLATLRFEAVDEAVTLQQVALQLTAGSASDVTKVTLWDGATNTKVGELVFTGANATSTVTGFVIPKDGAKVMTAKGDFALIGASQPGTQGALVSVDHDGHAADTAGKTTRGTGQSAGQTIYSGATTDTASAGARMFRAYPTVARVTSGLPTAYGGGGSAIKLYRFSVKANTHDVSLFKFSLRIATSTTGGTTDVANVKVYGYTDSAFSSPVSPWTSGQLNATQSAYPSEAGGDINVVFGGTGAPADQKLTIPSGSTYYFEVTGDINLTGSPTGGSVTTQLQGDDTYPTGGVQTAAGIVAEAATLDNFIWSPNATTTSLTTHADWTNGFRVDGLPASNLDTHVISK